MIVCPYCDEKFGSRHERDKHLAENHVTDENISNPSDHRHKYRDKIREWKNQDTE